MPIKVSLLISLASLEIITIEADIAKRTIEIPAAAAIIPEGSPICDNIASDAVSSAIMTAIITRLPTLDCILLPAFSTIANIPISADKHKVGATRSFGSSNDNSITHAVSTPIATAIAMMLPLHSFAPSQADIIPAINIDKKPITIIPFAIADGLSRSMRNITPTRMPIATLNDSRVAPTFRTSPFFWRIMLNAATKSVKTTRNPNPFSIVTGSSLLIC